MKRSHPKPERSHYQANRTHEIGRTDAFADGWSVAACPAVPGDAALTCFVGQPCHAKTAQKALK